MTGSDLSAQINGALSSGNAGPLLKFFDASYLISNQEMLSSLSRSNFGSQIRPPPWNEYLTLLVQVPNRPSPKDALEYFSRAVVPISSAALAPELVTPVIRTITRSLVYFAQEYPEDCYDDSVNCLRKFLQSRTLPQGSFTCDSPFLAILNALVTVHLLKNDFQLASRALDNVRSKTTNLNQEIYSVSEIAAFNFLSGKVDLIFGRYDMAKERLSNALLHIPDRHSADRRQILAYLVPLNLLKGIVPSAALIEKYELDVYAPVVRAVIDGQIADFDTALETNRMLFLRLGVWEVVVQSRKIVERRLLEMVHLAWKELSESPLQLPFEVAFNAFGEVQECTPEQAEMIVCALVYEGLVHANVVHEKRVIVLPLRKPPFPPLPLE
jgi:tetratricopeptide (TPR) repeat protein